MEALTLLAVKVAAILVVVNLALSFIAAGLEKIKDQTATDKDNKAHALLQKILPVVQKIVDFLSANVAHKK